MKQDILADELSAIDNARSIGKQEVVVEPASNLIKNVLHIMQKEEYIGLFEKIDDGKGGKFKVQLKNTFNECKAIKPRFSVDKGEFQKYEKRYLPARGFGKLILTTSQGIMTHDEAREEGIGGKLLAYVY
ncbi:MAG: 30S ribosomal protein S8 [Candidatus Nanohaloarchaeota archaeon QJJ-9]|nr:30S ribosomal protein S8 [Candidatus Nanohaloarchaeota archaeon QJJ-9]